MYFVFLYRLFFFTLANAIYSWGLGEYGRLGHGDEKDYNVPTLINEFKNKVIQSVSCGAEHSAAVVEGSLYTWGKGEAGRLGHGSEKNELAPR